MKILITGGHPAPALAVIHELLKQGYQDIEFVGKQYTQEGSMALSYEYKQVTKQGIPFHTLRAGKLTRVVTRESFKDIPLTGKGFIEAFNIVRHVRPDIIVSFGGYIALPICIVGKVLSIKVITHEQTIAPGLANKIIGTIADKVLISFPETMKYFTVRKTRLTGNPIREEAKRTLRKPCVLPSSKPILYVTGGSLGSHSINVLIETLLPKLLKTFTVIHQSGNVEKYGDYARLSRIKKKGYIVREHFASDEVGWIFKNAHIIVTRAGANTTFELILFRKPCVLIPLPWSASGEQEKHARLITQAGAGEVYNQSDSSDALYEKIIKVYQEYQSYKKNFALLQKYLHKDAAEMIVHEIFE
ncbi:hypothetical protein A3I56_01400 [Candidatus Roizmanbacteria bacterium RIFCSPLOWO2_02_FULL_43_10]|uniref:UDP-N-acetylglucosamine--N-acetylmuramyl-(pentapeptide) pyrophosphoryl-undecaprenol N-acetylglucosamine transferase n=3 Tax=Candidatus Roizmaniibacteriota TaxID=1752723 RepID=A0A1F7JTR1_9BACT|nr:MAG: hypothetical protein A3D08_03910 [Candidatus Roizmanbacteria bacterium RIFCSPHIGHO2_02_FULL_43_11]OGK38522.1 MAG: hypothetical protein A3F32_02925 [Candidatus Roizmanbacteria bacterium RIFCSPHIGHO2_12_FULL_42_10]OGK58988.1 MAG: hypothetical protein A3I56_01400 [Candidatus Roizmanbacteria bacterium RIFCSPLOWO2_02_FULL_43_10]